MSYGGSGPEGEQEFEHQELVDMVHERRGVTPGQEPEQQTPRRATRITHHEIKAMKVTVRKESSPVVGLFRQIGGMFSGLAQAIGGLFSGRASRVNPCEINGHVFPKSWKGDFPRCVHCRTVIKSPGDIKPK